MSLLSSSSTIPGRSIVNLSLLLWNHNPRKGSSSSSSTTPKRRLSSSILSLLQKPRVSSSSSSSLLQPALDHAVAIVRKHDPAGYLPGKLLATPDMQVAYFAVRSFWVETGLRFGSSTAFIPPHSSPAQQLEWWQQGIEQMYSKEQQQASSSSSSPTTTTTTTSTSPNKKKQQQQPQPPQQEHPTLQLLSHLQQEHHWNKSHFDDILKGRFLDLDLKQYPDMNALEEHAEWSCGSLMQLILESDGLHESEYPTAHRTAKLLGRAHGLTNALRTSIPVMSTTGKLIIPQDLCERYGVKSPRYLLSALGQGDQECIQALRLSVQDIGTRAQEYLQQARDLRSAIKVEAEDVASGSETTKNSKYQDILGVYLPGLASEAFLKRLEEHQYDLTDRNLRNVNWSEHAQCSLRMVQASYRQQY